MKKHAMKGTQLSVSPIALGTAQFGTGVSPEQAFIQLDTFTEFGGNMIDTAHVYGNWIPGMDSPSEETIGKWLLQTKKREKIVLVTKGGHPIPDRMSGKRVNSTDLDSDLEGSLRKLCTDYIDLYLLHQDDPDKPVEEILDYLEKKVSEGKIRYYGCSNWSLERIEDAKKAAERNHFKGFACNQAMGCLADVHKDTLPPSNTVLDKKMRAYHQKTQMPFMAYMSMARGYFVKRMENKDISQESWDNYTCASNERILQTLKELCADTGYSVQDFCYQYLIRQKFLCIPVAGFSSITQMKQAINAVNIEMPDKYIEELAVLKQLQ